MISRLGLCATRGHPFQAIPPRAAIDGRPVHRRAGVRAAAPLAPEQSAQEKDSGGGPSAEAAPISPKLRLGRVKQSFRDDRWDGDREPVGWWTHPNGPAALIAAVEPGSTCVGLIRQDKADTGPRPRRPARRPEAQATQLHRDLAGALLLGDEPVEHHPHGGGFVQVHDQGARHLRVRAIAKRRRPAWKTPAAGFLFPPSGGPFQDLEPLKFGNRASHMQEELGLWGIALGRGLELHADPGPLKLLHEQQLKREFPR